MDVEWFCRISGEVAGPFSAQQLKELAQRGRLAREDQVRHGIDGSWTPANRVKGLFPSVRAAPSEQGLPIAQPLGPTAIRTAEPLNVLPARPASQLPAKSPPATADPFEIQTDDQRPIARATRTGPRKKDRLRTFLVGGSIAVLAVCLVALVILVDPSMHRPAEDPQPPSTADRSADKDFEEDFETRIDKPPSEPSKTLPDESPPEPKEEEIKWLSTEQPIQIENVRIEILSAEIGPVRLISESGEIHERHFLQITIGVENVDEKNELKYTSWGVRGPTSAGLTLSDIQGKRYLTVRPRSSRIEGQLTEETLAPSTSVEDVLVFQAPADPANGLRLQLPCAAFGEAGSLYLELPAEMISVADRPTELPEMGLRSNDTEAGDAAPPVSNTYDEDEDPDGDISKINRDIDEMGGGEQDPAERAFDESSEGE